MTISPPQRPVRSGAAAVQLLTPEGERVAHPDYDVSFRDQDYRDLYRDMALVRRVDIEATALQRQGELGLWASCLGQEAAQVGIDPTLLLGQFRGVKLGGWDPSQYRCALYAIVIGSQTLHATGYAMGVAKDGALGDDGEAVIVYFGDGASSQGDVNESFNFASVFQAPVVFFCQNNGWAISEPSDRQSRVAICERSAGFGFPGIQVDGNDVLACYAVARQALDAARTGQGPTLIEAVTYRMGAHTTSDDPTRYRLQAELESWKLKDPLERLKAFLYRQQIADRGWFQELDGEADGLARRLRAECLGMPDPDPVSMFEQVYEQQTESLQAEQLGYAEYLTSFEAS
jgi:2-oxoisovalerate dehydrogenase E1 component alpha subunit